MADELTADLNAIGRELEAALTFELASMTPLAGGWPAVRDRVFVDPGRPWRARWSPRRMALVVAAAVAVALLMEGAVLAAGRMGVMFQPHRAHTGQQLPRPAKSVVDVGAAESAVGFHLLTATGYPQAQLVGVETLGQPSAPGAATAPPGVRLTYHLEARTVVVGEFDTSGQPPAGTVIGSDRHGQQESVARHDTVVTYDAQGRVTGMLWTTSNLTIAVGFDPGVSHQVAVEFAEHLQ